jgi:hypothetical protein
MSKYIFQATTSSSSQIFAFGENVFVPGELPVNV